MGVYIGVPRFWEIAKCKITWAVAMCMLGPLRKGAWCVVASTISHVVKPDFPHELKSNLLYIHIYGSIIGVIKGDTRSLDYIAHIASPEAAPPETFPFRHPEDPAGFAMTDIP